MAPAERWWKKRRNYYPLISPLGVCIQVEIYRDCGKAADA
jgi:hypothetical protein